jgi:hypothetical protein
LARAAAGMSMRAGLSMVRSFACHASHANAPMLQECHLLGPVRLEAMITIARCGRTTRPRPRRAIAMAVLFVVAIPPP